jgi:hypothetical protein
MSVFNPLQCLPGRAHPRARRDQPRLRQQAPERAPRKPRLWELEGGLSNAMVRARRDPDFLARLLKDM